jgi:polyhydroxyalkanoate synthesis regulator phasin/archaellum component FlaC
MEFSSQDIERFIEAIEADEHLRARVERAILSDRMYELPDRLAELTKQVEKLTEIVMRFIEKTEKRLDNIEADVSALKSDVSVLKSDVGTLKADVGTLKADVGTLKADVGTLKADVGTLKADVGTLKGSDYERSCREFAPAILGKVNGGLRRLRSIQRETLADLLDDAVDRGAISQKQRDDVLATDLVMQARSKANGEEVYLAVEASVTIDLHDVTRARERARTLSAALEKDALGVVITAHSPVIDTPGIEIVLYQGSSSAA